jgi:hypothetical protein
MLIDYSRTLMASALCGSIFSKHCIICVLILSSELLITCGLMQKRLEATRGSLFAYHDLFTVIISDHNLFLCCNGGGAASEVCQGARVSYKCAAQQFCKVCLPLQQICSLGIIGISSKCLGRETLFSAVKL